VAYYLAYGDFCNMEHLRTNIYFHRLTFEMAELIVKLSFSIEE